jgi:hypothetical protein
MSISPYGMQTAPIPINSVANVSLVDFTAQLLGGQSTPMLRAPEDIEEAYK